MHATKGETLIASALQGKLSQTQAQRLYQLGPEPQRCIQRPIVVTNGLSPPCEPRASARADTAPLDSSNREVYERFAANAQDCTMAAYPGESGGSETLIMQQQGEVVTLGDNGLLDVGGDVHGGVMRYGTASAMTGEDTNMNPVPVYFTDSPSVARRGTIEASPVLTGQLVIHDGYVSTPVSGSFDGAGARCIPDAAYVKTLTAEGDGNLSGRQVYYTDRCTIGGVACDENDDAIQVTETIHGDFDGDKATGDEQNDVGFFNDHFPTVIDCPLSGCDPQNAGCYNALADFDGSGRVDCGDRAVFLANFPGATGVEYPCS